MATENSKINYTVSATDAGASATFAKIGQSINQVGYDANKTFGESGPLGQMGKVLQGAGRIAGFAIIGRLMKDATEKALELRDALNSGAMSAAELAEETVKLIPIVGSFWQAGRNIKEMFTGEIQAATAALKEANAEMKKLFERNTKDIGARKFIKDTAERARFDQRREALPELEQRKLDADKQRSDALRALDEQRRNLLATGGMRGEEYAEAKKAIEDLHQQRMDALDAEHAEALRLAAVAARAVGQREEDAAKKRLETRRKIIAGFAEEDKRTELENRAEILNEGIRQLEANQPRRGALADTVTDLGRSGQLAAMERRSADPNTGILSQSRKELAAISATLKAMQEDAKRRDREGRLRETGMPIFN